VSLAAGEPALDLFPTEAFRAAVDDVLTSHGTMAWGHAPTEGQGLLRETLARRFGGDPGEILVIGGAQQGLDLLARCLIDRGDAVIVDRPGYLGALQSFRSAGARMFGWDVARADMDELEDLLLRYRPKLIYTNPTFQNPTGATLSIRARRELIELATRMTLDRFCQERIFRPLGLRATSFIDLSMVRARRIQPGNWARVVVATRSVSWQNCSTRTC
jgi:DNA-binding transcriptional MocR family regulator